MNDYLVMNFGDAESAAAYLQQMVGEAGLKVQITERGFEVEDILPDPARIAAQLSGRGIKDKALIERTVNEANNAITRVETFVQALQASLPTQDQSVGAVSSDTQQIGDPFAALVAEWINLIPSEFSGTGIETSTPGATPTGLSGTGIDTSTPGATPTNIPSPANLLTMESESPTGVIIRLNLRTAISTVVDSGSAPGIFAAPFTSVFDTAPNAWSLIA